MLLTATGAARYSMFNHVLHTKLIVMTKGLLSICLMCLSLILQAQDFTNKGKDFWIGYGNHVRMFTPAQSPEQMQLYITSDVSTTGKAEIPGTGFSAAFTVTANQITTIDIPRTAALLDEGIYNLGIHVTQTNRWWCTVLFM